MSVCPLPLPVEPIFNGGALMPRYDYQCPRCGNIEELFRPMQEKLRPHCRNCKETMTRLISGGGGVIFKGPGWTRRTGTDKPDA